MRAFRTRLKGGSIAAIVAVELIVCGRTSAEDKFLSEVVDFTGTLTYLNAKVPGFILVVVRDGETAFTGLGSITDKQDKKPAPDTIFRIGSISKAFCGEVLASMALDGKLRFSDRVQDRLGYAVMLPERGWSSDPAHQPGDALVRSAPRTPAGPGAAERSIQHEHQRSPDQLLFPPGTAALYSNYGFDLLGAALSHVGGKPYADILRERVLDPTGMRDTVFNLRPGDEARVMQGHILTVRRCLPCRHPPASNVPGDSTRRRMTWRAG